MRLLSRALILFVIVLEGCVLSPRVNDSEVLGTRYVYCNVYVDIVCFGVARGDSLNMELLSDFILYNVEFEYGASAIIYSGFHPQVVNDEWQSIGNPCRERTVVCELFQKGSNRFRIIYQVEEDGEAVDIYLNTESGSNFAMLNEFLQNFRRCMPQGHGVSCTNKRVFNSNLLNKFI